MTKEAKINELKLRSEEKAVKDISRALKKAGVEYDADELARNVHILYNAWDEGQIEPTCTRLANLIHDNDAAVEVIKNMERDPFIDNGRDKKKVIGIVAGAAAAAVIAAIGLGVALDLPTQAAPEPTPAPSATQTQEAATYPVTVVINAKGAENALTPAKFEILDTTGAVVVAETEAAANTETQIGKLEAGSYSLRMTAAPVLKDGSTYTLPKEATAFDVAESNTPVTVTVMLEKLDADDMTKEQLEAAANEVKQSGNTSAAQAISDKATHAQSKPGSDATVSAEPTPAPSKPSSGGNSGGNSSKPSQPSHTHTWVHHDAEYKTVHHDAEYKTVHHDAVYEDVIICLDCGKENPGRDHLEQHWLKGENGATTVETRLVKDAYDEKVLVKEAWDEKVLVKAAYDSCSCGATK